MQVFTCLLYTSSYRVRLLHPFFQICISIPYKRGFSQFFYNLSRIFVHLVLKPAARSAILYLFMDDVLDVTSTPEQLGKPIGSDSENGKTTFVTLYGTDGAMEMCIRDRLYGHPLYQSSAGVHHHQGALAYRHERG